MASPKLFEPIAIRGVVVKNRIVIAPMHQYAAVDGFAQDWHLTNIGRYAAGGAGVVFVESTKFDRRGCGTIGDLGIWSDGHVAGLRRLADHIRANGAVPAIQLGHSGRKARRTRPWEGGEPLTRERAEAEGVTDWDDWELVSSTDRAPSHRSPAPRALSRTDVQALVVGWGEGVKRAAEAGFDIVEIHGAHGYLVHQFLSPASNDRTDEYGGSEANRRRFLLEIVEEARRFWPAEKPLFVRLSVEDDCGFGPDQSVNVARAVAPLGADVIDCSSGGMTGSPVDSGTPSYGYQVPYAARIKRDTDLLSMAVGLIVHADQAEGILQDDHADLIAIAREAMFNPNWPMDAAMKLGAPIGSASSLSRVNYWLENRRTAGQVMPSTFGAGIERLTHRDD